MPGVSPATEAVAGEAVLDLYRRETAASDADLATLSLDAARELLDGRTWMGPQYTRQVANDGKHHSCPGLASRYLGT